MCRRVKRYIQKTKYKKFNNNQYNASFILEKRYFEDACMNVITP